MVGHTDNPWWLSLQHDWKEGFKHKEKVWISVHKLGQRSVQSYLRSSGPTDNDFTMEQVNDQALKVLHKDSGTSSLFLSPSVAHKPSPKTNPVSVDVTSSVTLGASTSGKDVMVWEVVSGIVRRLLVGHLADVTCVKFFPSNLVLLTGGEDMCLKIWSVEDGSCPVTLTGHKRAVTSLQIVDKGKNIVSSSLDGTVKLWSCATAKCLHSIEPKCGGVNDISLFARQAYEGVEGEGQVLTSDKMVLSVTESSSLFVHALSDGALITHYTHSSPLNSCTAVTDDIVIGGSSNGDVVTLDLRNASVPLEISKRSNSPVMCVRSDTITNKVWVAQKDGSCYCLNVPQTPHSTSQTPHSTSQQSASLELCGGDCEVVYCIACKDNYVFTSSRDRFVRGYKLKFTQTTEPQN